MIETDHPKSLDAFVTGRLSDMENEAIFAHLATCQQCEAKIERLWQAAPIGNSVFKMPDLDIQDALESERSLFRRIHRSELGGQMVKFYTQSFFGLFTGLLRPFVNNFRKPESTGGKTP
jgi:hypothetical protein